MAMPHLGNALRGSVTTLGLIVILQAALARAGEPQPQPAGRIRFVYRPIAFTMENSETPEKYPPETMGGGVAVFDYDNDGDLDIFFTNGATMPGLKKTGPKYWNRLFANDGHGHFTDVTEKAGLAGTGYDTGVAVGDYNNDGYEDLFVGGVHHNTLYRNNGDGTFTNVTEQAGLGKPDSEYGPLWSVGGVWFDYDNDGKLDLFVTNYLKWKAESEPTCMVKNRRVYCHPKYYKGTPNRLYRNNGDGTFTDVSEATGIRQYVGKGMGAGVADFDGDGLPDIFVSNDKLPNFLFHNLGKKFVDTAFDSLVALPEDGAEISGMGVDIGDINNDGLPDIVFVALDKETFPVYMNSGKGYFEDITTSSRMASLSRRMAGYSPGIFDFDNDGWKDVFVSRGHVQSGQAEDGSPAKQHNSVFRNLGNGRFAALTDEAGLAAVPPARHRGAGFGDFDGDGRIDVVVSALSDKAEIWLNASAGGNHWLALKLEGTTSNRDAIGARVKLVSKSGVQYNQVSTAAAYGSSSAAPLHFGLGPDTVAQLIEIRWPSGTIAQLHNMQCDQLLKIKEPAAQANHSRPQPAGGPNDTVTGTLTN